ncbi:hypothetical protein RBG11_004250 [Vibrio parahaemolyticus]|nr:hypothetical protein [Vibrio parahaemolyticus]
MILAYATGLQQLVEREYNIAQGSLDETPLYTKESVKLLGGATQAEEIVLRFPPRTTFGFSTHYSQFRNGSWASGHRIIEIRDDNDNVLFMIDGDTSETLNFYEYITSSSPTKFYDYIPANNSVERLDFDVKIDAVSGYFRVYFNNALIHEVTGDTTRSGTFGTVSRVFFGGVDETDGTHHGGMFITDGESTLDITMVQHTIQSAGRFAEMTGDFGDLISIGTLNDSASVVSTAANQTMTAVIDGLPDEFQGHEIVAVGVDVRASADSGGSYPLALVIDDGTNVLESASISGKGYFTTAQALFTTAPDGTAWDATKLANTDIGVRSK